MSINPLNTKKQAIVSQKDLNLLLRIIKTNWWVPLIVLPIFYVLGAFYVYRLTSVYQVSTELLLKVNDTYYQNNVLSDQSFYTYGSYVDNLNEQRIIQSYDLSSQVVDKLMKDIHVSYFIIGKVITTEQFKTLPFDVNVYLIPASYYETVFDFKIIDYNNYEISYEHQDVDLKSTKTKVTKRGKFNEEFTDENLRLNIKRTDIFTEKNEIIKEVFYQFRVHSRDYLISNIQSNLTIENPEYTNVLIVGLKDVIPQRAILILDTLNSVYSLSKLKTKFDLNERTISYIDKQLDEITLSLNSIEDTMQNYKQKKSIIDLNWEQSNFLSNIGLYDKQKSELKLQISSLNDLEKYIVEDKDPQFLPPSVFISEKSGFLFTAVNDLYTKQIELNKVYNIAKETNPIVIDLKTSIRKTKQDLLIYINNTRKASNQQIVSLDQQILNYINEAKLIPGKQQDILNIQRRATISERLYNFLLEKRANTKISRASIVPDIKIVESPRDVGVVSPDKPGIQKSFLSFGLVISLLIILLRSLFYLKITSVEHLKELTQIPLIGVLPFVKEEKINGLIVENDPASVIAESFRNLRTNLMYANIGIEAKTYLVTSFLPTEGKTFTSANLACTFAQSGKKTVLLELDLHKPRIYKIFSLLPPTKGLTTCISGIHTYEEIISETHVPNLYCIYAGPVPPNPSEFVLSQKLKEIIKQAENDFDVVIIDSPPAGLLSDSIYLMEQVDATLFVLNTKTSTKRVISFMENVTEANNHKNLLLVLNGVSRIGKRYYYQGYGYSYGYGFGYGYGKGYGIKRPN